jgi:hypothetical protein
VPSEILRAGLAIIPDGKGTSAGVAGFSYGLSPLATIAI